MVIERAAWLDASLVRANFVIHDFDFVIVFVELAWIGKCCGCCC